MKTELSAERLFAWADKRPPPPSLAGKTFHSFCRICCITVREFRKNELSIRSAALTFTVILSLIPVLAMSAAIVKGMGGGDQLRKTVYEYVNTLERRSVRVVTDKMLQTEEPEISNISENLHAVVDKIFNYIDQTNFATLGTFGILGIVISVILVFGNIEMAMNTIWNVKNSRSIMRKISDYLAILILFPFSLNLGLAASAVLKSKALQEKFTILTIAWFQPLVLNLLPIFFIAVSFYVIYLFFPNTKVKTVPAFIGAVFSGFCWFEMQNIYIGLQLGVSKYNAIYGSFATLPLFLLWMYLGWIFILGGAQLAYACQNKKHYRLSPIKAHPSLQLAAAYDLIDYIEHNFELERISTVENFKDSFPGYPAALIESVAGCLIQEGLIHEAGEEKALMPSLPQNQLQGPKIVYAIFGSSFSDTLGGKKSRKAIETAAAPLADKKGAQPR